MASMREVHERAANWLRREGRPLDLARYACVFGNGTNEEILAELALFRNDDGGFGHAIEPDVRTSASSAIATTIALQILRAIEAPETDLLVAGAIRWLAATYDAERETWPLVPPEAGEAPYAPWWRPGTPPAPRALNPRAEIAGYFLDWPANVPGDLAGTLATAVTAQIADAPDDMEMHDFLCCVRFAETAELSGRIRTKVVRALRRIAKKIVATDPAGWEHYGLQPIAVMRAPDSPFANLFAGALAANLDWLVARQNSDGAWEPSWSWAESSADGWTEAASDWRSALTLDTLLVLRAHGRIDGSKGR